MTIFFEQQRQDREGEGAERAGACLCLRSEFNLVLAAASFGSFHGTQSTNVGLRRFFICFDVICNFHLPRSKEIVECDAIISSELTNQQQRERQRENEGSSRAIPRTTSSPFALPNLSPSSCSRSLIFLVGSQCLTAIWQEFDSSRKSDISLPGINKYLMEAAAHYVGLLCQPKCDRYLK